MDAPTFETNMAKRSKFLLGLLTLGLILTPVGLTSCKGTDTPTSSNTGGSGGTGGSTDTGGDVDVKATADERFADWEVVSNGGKAYIQGTVTGIEKFDSGSTNVYITDGTHGYRVTNVNKIEGYTPEVGKTYLFVGTKINSNDIKSDAQELAATVKEVTTVSVEMQELSSLSDDLLIGNSGYAVKITGATLVSCGLSGSNYEVKVNYNSKEYTITTRGTSQAATDMAAKFADCIPGDTISYSVANISYASNSYLIYALDATKVTIEKIERVDYKGTAKSASTEGDAALTHSVGDGTFEITGGEVKYNATNQYVLNFVITKPAEVTSTEGIRATINDKPVTYTDAGADGKFSYVFPTALDLPASLSLKVLWATNANPAGDVYSINISGVTFAELPQVSSTTIDLEAFGSESKSSFNVSSYDPIVANSNGFITSVSEATNTYGSGGDATSQYPERLAHGVKFGTSSKAGSLTLQLSQQVKSLTIHLWSYGDDTGQIVDVNGVTQTMSTAINVEAPTEFVLNEPSNTITIKGAKTSKGRFYITKIVFNY